MDDRLIASEDLTENQRRTPAVQEQVVMTPREQVGVLSDAKESQAEERRLPKFKPPSTICHEKCLQPVWLVPVAQTAPVLQFPGSPGVAMHELHGPVQLFPVE